MLDNMHRLHPRGPANPGICVDRDGAMLGPDCVLVGRTRHGFRGIGREAASALQKCVLGSERDEDWLFRQCERIADSLNKGQIALAQIYGLRIPIGKIDDGLLKRLAAEGFAKWSFNPDEPRVPKGDPHGGEWTTPGANAGNSDARHLSGLSALLVDQESTANGAPDVIVPGPQIAQGNENIEPEEIFDPLAPIRIIQFNDAIETLRQLDPNNPQLSSIAGPNWIPNNQDITAINLQIENIVSQRVTNFIIPGGNPVGEAGGGRDIRVITGGSAAAQAAFDYLSVGGRIVTGTDYPGTLVQLPGNAGYVGLRTSISGPAVDVNVPGIPYRTLHY